MCIRDRITKAMELVASSKLRKAKERAEVCRPYFRTLYETLKEIAVNNTEFNSVYAAESKSNKYCYVVIAGDRDVYKRQLLASVQDSLSLLVQQTFCSPHLCRQQLRHG